MGHEGVSLPFSKVLHVTRLNFTHFVAAIASIVDIFNHLEN